MKIEYIKHADIDIKKWNRCVNTAVNGNVYVYSWYLDIVCENWDALVSGDYEIIMPLTKKSKYNIQYLYQPVFTQQLGVFSAKYITAEIVKQFLDAIPSKFRFVDIKLNTSNYIQTLPNVFKTNVTYELDLIESYESTFKTFSTNTKRNLSKALTNKMVVNKNIIPSQMLQFYAEHVGEKLGFKREHYDQLYKIITFAIANKMGEMYACYNPQNQLCAAAFLISSHQKSIFLLSVSSPEGKENSAMFLIINYYISNYSEKFLTLDFEGSNNDGIARFYAGFGAQSCKYLTIKRNILPWYIKIFKR